MSKTETRKERVENEKEGQKREERENKFDLKNYIIVLQCHHTFTTAL